jgi:hypothetical protein
VAAWWELAIPVASTLAGGALGAWWQARESERGRVFQADEAQAVRGAQARSEEAARFFAERRRAYAAFISSSWDCEVAYYETGVQLGAPPDSADAAETQRYAARRERVEADWREATARFRAASVDVKLIGSRALATLAEQLEVAVTALGQQNSPGLGPTMELLEAFIDRARLELQPETSDEAPDRPHR